MAYNVVAVPTSGTPITTAWAALMIDNDAWFRQYVPDPGAANLPLVSDSTTAASFRQVPTAGIADLAVTNAKLGTGAALANIGAGGVTNTYLGTGAALANIGAGGVTNTYLGTGAALANIGAGGVTNTYLGTGAVLVGNLGSMNGAIIFENNNSVVGKESGGTQRALVGIGADNKVNVGNTATITEVFGSSVKINGGTGWHSGNDGSGSGLDADTVDGAHLSALPTLAGGGNFTTAPTINSDAVAVIASGNYSGDGGTSGRQITTGFVPRMIVLHNITDTSAALSESYICVSTSKGMDFQGGHMQTLDGVLLHATDGFTVANGSNNGNRSGKSYYWVAFG